MTARDIEVEVRRDVTVFPNEFRIFVFVDGDVKRLSIDEAKKLEYVLRNKIEDAEMIIKAHQRKESR